MQGGHYTKILACPLCCFLFPVNNTFAFHIGPKDFTVGLLQVEQISFILWGALYKVFFWGDGSNTAKNN